MAPRTRRPAVSRVAEPYQHTQETPMRPEVGTQAQFRKRKAPKTYRYDSSLDPALSWDDGASRAMGEWLLSLIVEASKLPSPHRFAEAKQFLGAGNAVLLTVGGLADAVKALEDLGKPFLDWAGKAERLSMEVPTLPLFIHERLSTQAILQTLKGHKREGVDQNLSLFGDPQRPLAERMRPYEHRDKWVNRMVLGDSLVVMNSLLEYEGMGGQAQMIYMDPPYGVKFGSNFQPFVRKRDVKNNDDADLTREPEMVQAYRDTWELGLHSYLTYLRDRLVIARDLLTPSGSIFVQISDENLHHVREVMDEVFGQENHAGIITFYKTSSQGSNSIPSVTDFLLCYAKDISRQTLRTLHQAKQAGERGAKQYTVLISPDLKEIARATAAQIAGAETIPTGWRFCTLGPTTSQDYQEGRSGPYKVGNHEFKPAPNRHWSYDPSPGMEMDKLVAKGRLRVVGASLRTILLAEDNPVTDLDNVWMDTGSGSFTEDQLYVVQTSQKVIQRCILMTTNPGDLVLDPTCGSGTTAYVAEHWGRRWLTCDTSRVPLALARQRLLTALFPWYKVKDGSEHPSAGFEYQRRQNRRGEEVGGIVPHITLSSVANDRPPEEEVLVDRPEEDKNVTRITGPFVFEATIPTPLDVDGAEKPETELAAQETPSEQAGSYTDRMLDILRRSPLLRLEGNRTVQLHNIRPLTRTLAGLLEATVDAAAEEQAPTLTNAIGEAAEANGALLTGLGSPDRQRRPVAILLGPENGSISEGLVYAAAKEAFVKGYTHLYCIGFAIEPNARQTIESSADGLGVPATYVQATMDLNMGDLLKNMRSSQIFSVCGLPDVAVMKQADGRYQVELKGLDVFDPITMENHHAKGDDVPAWLLDTDYNGMCFHVTQAFFPRTSAWDALKKALKADYEASLWDHLAGSVSAPFEASSTAQIAVKVIDDRGNELMVVKPLSEAVAVNL
jgi:adenine-specific DNA-methyltransferase